MSEHYLIVRNNELERQCSEWAQRYAELEEELRQIRQALHDELHPVMWGLEMIAPKLATTPALLIAALYDAYPAALHRERLMLLRRAAKDDADPKLIDVQLHRARKTLRELGATGPIATPVYGFGFRLDVAAYEWIAARLTPTRNQVLVRPEFVRADLRG